MVRLCNNESRKNPTCEDIARILNIEFLPRGVSAAQKDRPEFGPANPPGNSDQGQGRGHTDSSSDGYTYSHGDGSGDYQAAPTGGHGGDYGSTSYHHHNHSDGGSQCHRDEVPRHQASGRHSDLSSLTSGMSALRVSSSNGSKRDRHHDRQTSSRVLAVSSHARSKTEYPRESTTARPRESATARPRESTTARPQESTADHHRHDEYRDTSSARKSSQRTTTSGSIRAPIVKYRSRDERH
ncbi:hypothetical protein C7999DRAFT_36491 [Corynascus novoguineensis]|uniref:Uncharacterized protein n=1 Tax=Corynascus novoguineensis TaxID=1126955 RepID=A0AAN7CKY5_9PEZI|nr:hypothetical protein C7999DRAFT_36491 [Corynascus novoguineensis]